MATAAGPPVLITIPISHFCEKARWALDRIGLAYVERPHLQALHWLAVRRAGGGRTVPVLVCSDGVLADSDDILGYADAHAAPERKLYPSDPAQAAEVRALEADFNSCLGPEARRWVYDGLRGRRDLALAYNATGLPAWERRTLQLGFGAMSRIIDRVLDVNPATAGESEVRVRQTFDAVGERLADGRPYLCGDRFTAADLTFSALASPMVMPPEYGVPLPTPDELSPSMAAVVHEMRAHPAGVHALAMYRDERR